MAGHRYISNSSVLFEDDDVDDETFVNSFRSRIPPPQTKPAAPSYGGHIGELERQRQTMLQKQREIEQRTLDSSARSVGLLRESEQIGIATAEELVRQREQLESTNRRLDEINTNLNYSQKHLNGIKSVFYGIKNYISGKSDPTPPRSQASPDARGMKAGSSSRLEDSISNSPSFSAEDRYNSHPSTRLRGLDEPASAAPISDSQRVNDILDANLGEMVQHITRLKGLGTALGEEIDAQNQLIDTLQDKVEVADIKIDKQNKQMNKLLVLVDSESEMSKHRYLSNSRVLFDDDDVTDKTCVNSFRSRNPLPQPKPAASYGGHTGGLEREKQTILQKQRKVEQETLDSSARSIALLHETTQIGITTSDELVRQGNQLKNTNRNLDEINMNLKDSQKHLIGMRSVFYGIKNYVSGKADQTLHRCQVSPGTHGTDQSGTSSRLEESRSNTPTFSAEDRYYSHPSTRLRGLDEPATAAPISDSQQVNTILDAHLDEMMQHITTLKGLGTAMGKEINEQNQLIDILQDKVEVADIKIDKQTKQISKFLGK